VQNVPQTRHIGVRSGIRTHALALTLYQIPSSGGSLVLAMKEKESFASLVVIKMFSK
jgi:hypothetical protein